MSEELHSYDVPHCYLEMARSIMDLQLSGKYSANERLNAVFALMSVTVVYSYLAVEAFVNGQLQCIWRSRHEGSPEGERFLSMLCDPATFEELKGHRLVRELPERVKTLCSILGIERPHETACDTWETFCDLVKQSRDFFVHPTPTPERFGFHTARVMERAKAGEYCRAAAELIGHFYDQKARQRPAWLQRNSLLRLKGVEKP